MQLHIRDLLLALPILGMICFALSLADGASLTWTVLCALASGASLAAYAFMEWRRPRD